MIRFASVGVTGYAEAIIKNIRACASKLDCRLVAVCIRSQSSRPDVVRKYAAEGVQIFADAVEMLDALRGKVDAVIVPTSISSHCEMTCAALERGHNVYLEKPPAATIQEVDRMLEAVNRSGKICLLGFQMISSDSINFIKSRVVSGALGTVKRLRFWACSPRYDNYYKRNTWAGKLKIDGAWVLDGPSNNALAHYISNMLYLASPVPRQFARPASVRAELYHGRDFESEDTCAMEIRTAEGPTAYFATSHCAETAGGYVITLECQKGSAVWQVGKGATITYADGRSETGADALPPNESALTHFVEALRAGDAGRLGCDLNMGRNFTLALNGAFESSGQAHPIPAKYLRRKPVDDGDAYTIIEGVDQAIIRCGEEGKLFSDQGVPWAVKTEPFDLTGYKHFPQRFRG